MTAAYLGRLPLLRTALWCPVRKRLPRVSRFASPFPAHPRVTDGAPGSAPAIQKHCRSHGGKGERLGSAKSARRRGHLLYCTVVHSVTALIQLWNSLLCRRTAP
eukprot:scaffold1850_cov194-Pinguiococcus_pyrenoidosus.AAC.22